MSSLVFPMPLFPWFLSLFLLCQCNLKTPVISVG
jgi:hypothetical protein